MNNFRPRTILEYIKMLWRQKFIVILFSIAMMIAAINAMRTVRNVYEASALVAISIQSSEERSAVDVQVAAANQHLLSRANLEPIVKRYRLYNGNNNIDAAVELLRKDLKVETKVRDYYPQFPISFTITYKHADPILAMQVTNDLATYFDNSNEVIEKRNAEEVNALEISINELETSLKSLNKQRIAKEQSAGNQNTVKVQRATLKTALDALNDKEFGLNQRITQQKRLVNEQEKILKVLPSGSNDFARSSAYGVLLAERARLEAQLKDQKSQYTEKNSKVIQTQSQISEVNKQLTQMDEKRSQSGLDASSPETGELRGLRRELTGLETDLELVQRDIKRKQQALSLLPEIEDSPSDIVLNDANLYAQSAGAGQKDIEGNTEYNLLFNRYSTLLEKRDSLRKFGKAGAIVGSGIFQTIDKAIVPVNPISPNRLKLLIISIVMALGIGIMAAFVIEAPKLLMVQDERDVEYLLGAPVIGLIPETLTVSESRHFRKLFLVRALGVLAFAVILVPALIILLKKSQIFQLLAK